MKQIIDGKTYNTGTASKIGEWDNGLGFSDFRHCAELLYKTRKRAWFVHGRGGAMTAWSESKGGTTWGGSSIRTLTEAEALRWCEDHDIDTDVIEEHFAIEEA